MTKHKIKISAEQAQKNRKEQRKYLVGGILFGFCFPIIALTVDFIHKEVVVSISGIIELHSINPLHYIIDSAPLILGGVFYYLGKMIIGEKTKILYLAETQLKIKKEATLFAVELSKGKFDAECANVLEYNDELCKALNTLQTNLKEKGKEEKLRKEENKKKNWVSKGLAHFADVLRKDNNSLTNLSYNLISSLVKYMEAVQGGVFLIEGKGDEKYLNMTACFAYDRRKYHEKSLKWGEGLIGTCVIEKQAVYMTKLPEEYIEITSGLGDAPPQSLLISPLIMNDEVFGAIEIASLNVFENHHRELIENLSEDFASTISSVLINIQTAKLLKESKKQSEQLTENEEMMRKSMEDAQQTFEDFEKREEQLKQEVSELRARLKDFED